MLDPNKTIQNGYVKWMTEDGNRVYRIKRLSRRMQDKCRHTWGRVPYSEMGHGKWGRVCIDCGKLGRV